MVREELNIDIVGISSSLSAFIIDSSTAIYAAKAGFLEQLGKTFRLYVPSEVVKELDSPVDETWLILREHAVVVQIPPFLFSEDLRFVGKTERKLSDSDKAVLKTHSVLGLPLLTDDYGIIRRAEALGARYYNALAALYFLMERLVMPRQSAVEKLLKLGTIGRYGKEIYSAVFRLFTDRQMPDNGTGLDS